jgi:hypothetical protein
MCHVLIFYQMTQEKIESLTFSTIHQDFAHPTTTPHGENY